MARQRFHSQIAFQSGNESGDGVIKSQLDTSYANAVSRANHTGSQLSSTISDFSTEVDNRIQLVVGAAPTALDTLVELAAALGDDPNFSTTVTTSLGDLDARVDTLEAAQGSSAGNFKITFGDAVASSYTHTHNLNSLDVRVDVIELATGQTVHPVVTRPSVNTVTTDFGSFVPTLDSHRVLITLVP